VCVRRKGEWEGEKGEIEEQGMLTHELPRGTVFSSLITRSKAFLLCRHPTLTLSFSNPSSLSLPARPHNSPSKVHPPSFGPCLSCRRLLRPFSAVQTCLSFAFLAAGPLSACSVRRAMMLGGARSVTERTKGGRKRGAAPPGEGGACAAACLWVGGVGGEV